MVAITPSNTLLLALFIMLSGCSTVSINTKSINTKSTKTDVSEPSPAKPAKSSQPCVYESTKGVAEVIEISPQQVIFKFYPGDQIFSLPAKAISHTELSLEQELKAIIRTPLSGPCEETEFELLSTIE